MPPIHMPFMYFQKVFVINHDNPIVREPQEKCMLSHRAQPRCHLILPACIRMHIHVAASYAGQPGRHGDVHTGMFVVVCCMCWSIDRNYMITAAGFRCLDT